MSKKRKTQTTITETSFAGLFECCVCREATTYPLGVSHECRHVLCPKCLLQWSARALTFHRPENQASKWHFDWKDTSCPECRKGSLSPFGGPEIRTLDRCIYKALNNGSELLSCRYQCGFHKEADLTLIHEFICWKRPFTCPFPDCEETFTMEVYRQYMESIVNAQKHEGEAKLPFVIKSLDRSHPDWTHAPKSHYDQYALMTLSRAALYHFQNHTCKHRIPCPTCRQTFSVAEIKNHVALHENICGQLQVLYTNSRHLPLTPEVLGHLAALHKIWSEPKLPSSSMPLERMPETSSTRVTLCPLPSSFVYHLPIGLRQIPITV